MRYSLLERQRSSFRPIWPKHLLGCLRTAKWQTLTLPEPRESCVQTQAYVLLPPLEICGGFSPHLHQPGAAVICWSVWSSRPNTWAAFLLLHVRHRPEKADWQVAKPHLPFLLLMVVPGTEGPFVCCPYANVARFLCQSLAGSEHPLSRAGCQLSSPNCILRSFPWYAGKMGSKAKKVFCLRMLVFCFRDSRWSRHVCQLVIALHNLGYVCCLWTLG